MDTLHLVVRRRALSEGAVAGKEVLDAGEAE
jgi:hypothetical protein